MAKGTDTDPSRGNGEQHLGETSKRDNQETEIDDLGEDANRIRKRIKNEGGMGQKIATAQCQESSIMHSVDFQTIHGTRTIQVQDGEVLRSALLKRDVSPHNGKSRLINCRGLGTCGTCAIEIVSKSGNGLIPTKKNTKEKLRLSFPPHDPTSQSSNLRLACQVQVCGDLTVTKRNGFWGQGNDLAEEFDAKLYLGNLEYVLDDRSPSKPEAKDSN